MSHSSPFQNSVGRIYLKVSLQPQIYIYIYIYIYYTHRVVSFFRSNFILKTVTKTEDSVSNYYLAIRTALFRWYADVATITCDILFLRKYSTSVVKLLTVSTARWSTIIRSGWIPLRRKTSLAFCLTLRAISLISFYR